MIALEQEIKQFVLDTFLFGGSLDDIDENASFLANGTIDSLGVLELIAFAEERYGVEVEDDEVVPANFDGVRRLANYIRTKQCFAVVA